MKIYNSGHRNYAMGTITIAPSRTKPTDIPPELEEHARWLLKTYSAELSEAPESGVNVAALASKAAELALDDANATVAKLEALLAGRPALDESKPQVQLA